MAKKITKTIMIIREDRLMFDTGLKHVLETRKNAFVQIVGEMEDKDYARAIRSILADYTSAGEEPADVFLSGFGYDEEIIAAVEKANNCKLVWTY